MTEDESAPSLTCMVRSELLAVSCWFFAVLGRFLTVFLGRFCDVCGASGEYEK